MHSRELEMHVNAELCEDSALGWKARLGKGHFNVDRPEYSKHRFLDQSLGATLSETSCDDRQGVSFR
jgi:hypothetical protein